MVPRRAVMAALLVPFALLAGEEVQGQGSPAQALEPTASVPARPSAPDADLSVRGLSPGSRSTSTMLEEVALGPRLSVGIGRFEALPLARPRTHMERSAAPTAVRDPGRNIAGLRFSFSF
jgi:hypothetical protein